MQVTNAVQAASSPTRLLLLAVQHVLVMYAGAVAVPLILGSALKLPHDQVALLINADLFACGIATFMQAYGIGPVGINWIGGGRPNTPDFGAPGYIGVAAVALNAFFNPHQLRAPAGERPAVIADHA